MMELERVPISSISFDPDNARRHGPKNIQAIRASLERFGQQKPIVVDLEGVVRAGNGTLAAAQDLGWTEIDIVRSRLEGADISAFALADNRTSELAEWDYEVLAAVIQELEAQEPNRGEELGWSSHELDAILSSSWDLPGPDQDDLEGLQDAEEGSGPGKGQADLEPKQAQIVSVNFSEQELEKIDEVALILSPDASLGRKKTLMTLVNQKLER